MPKTATGKVQRRLVAKAMIDNEEKAFSEPQLSLRTSAPVDQEARKWPRIPTWLIVLLGYGK